MVVAKATYHIDAAGAARLDGEDAIPIFDRDIATPLGLLPRDDLPVLVLIDGWKSFWAERAGSWRSSAGAKLRAQLEERILPTYLAKQRWFAPRTSCHC